MVEEIEIGDEVSEYKFLPMPYVSKTRVKGWKYCQYGAWLEICEEEKQKTLDEAMRIRGVVGTDTHIIFDLFFDEVIERGMIDHFMQIKLEIDPFQSQLYWAFFAICSDLLPQSVRGVELVGKIISNFAEFQVQNWTWITTNLGSSKRIYEKYWIPCRREVFLIDPGMKYYGTIDAVYRNPNMERGNDTRPYIFIDYKTGHVPNSVANFVGTNRSSCPIPTDKMLELHFYAWLISTGVEENATISWKCIREREMLDQTTMETKSIRCDTIIENKLCPSCGKLYENNNDLFLERVETHKRIFPEVKTFQDVIGNIVYLGGRKPHSIPKTMNTKSMSNIHIYAAELRNMWEKHKDDESEWKKKESKWSCEPCYNSSACVGRAVDKMVSE